MGRHVPIFLLLALAGLAPVGLLAWNSSRTLQADLALARAEERTLHDRAATAIAERIRGDLDKLLRQEQARHYSEYSYFHAPVQSQVLVNTGGNFAYNVSPISGDVPGNPLINGYLQMDPSGRLETPQTLGNPNPGPEQVASSQNFLQKLQGFSKLSSRIRTQGNQAQKPQRREPVDRRILDANRHAKERVATIQKANEGDRPAQEEIRQLAQQEDVPTEETVEIDYYPFQVFTLGGGGVGVKSSTTRSKDPIILALRRVVEQDEKMPREYFQGFELNLDHLKKVTFPRAIAAVAAPNFTASVVSRNQEGDRSVVRNLGPLLPHFELRSGPASPDKAVEGVRERHSRFQVVLGILACITAAALVLFWRLIRGEVDLGRRRQEFVSAVTHELKTPLTSIRMYAELLEDRWVEDPEKQQDYFTTIRSESERLSRLISNVLDYSRLERGKGALALVEVDAAVVARETLEALTPQVEDRGGRLRLHVPEPLPAVHLDRDAFTQVLINLVDNAVKYGSPTGAIDVTLTATPEHLVVTVDNQGDSIPRKERRRIFQDFRRGPGRGVREVSGVGLGLALVRRFARAHGGTVRCMEPVRPGARFQVTFRLAPGRGLETT